MLNCVCMCICILFLYYFPLFSYDVVIKIRVLHYLKSITDENMAACLHIQIICFVFLPDKKEEAPADMVM